MTAKTKTLWTITIILPKDTVKMTFTNHEMAQQELGRIRAMGTFGGQWITSIDLI